LIFVIHTTCVPWQLCKV